MAHTSAGPRLNQGGQHGTTNPTIEFAGVSKAFGHSSVLEGLDLTVERGEVFALLGANGAGKTTSINILTTLIRPDVGTVRLSGIDVVKDPEAAKLKFSVTGQSAAVDGLLSTAENLVMLGKLSGLTRRQAKDRAEQLAHRLSLETFVDKKVSELSGGMRRRLDLALSLVVPVEVLVLDEPTTGLDTRSRRELWDEVRELAASGTTVFLTTQYLEEADALADRVGLLDRGRLAGLGTPNELKSTVGQDTVSVHDHVGDTVREIPTNGSVSEVAAVLRSLEPEFGDSTVALRKPSLDDVFLSFTSGKHVPTIALGESDSRDTESAKSGVGD